MSAAIHYSGVPCKGMYLVIILLYYGRRLLRAARNTFVIPTTSVHFFNYSIMLCYAASGLNPKYLADFGKANSPL